MKNYRWTIHFGNVFIVVYASSRYNAMILACATRISSGEHLDCNRIAQWDGNFLKEEWNGKFTLKFEPALAA